MSDDQACAHLKVIYRTETAEGVTHGWWECRACELRFVPTTPLGAVLDDAARLTEIRALMESIPDAPAGPGPLKLAGRELLDRLAVKDAEVVRITNLFNAEELLKERAKARLAAERERADENFASYERVKALYSEQAIRLAAVERERDEVREEIEVQKALLADEREELRVHVERLNDAQTRVHALEGALRKYGRHADRCQTGRLDTITAGVRCVCGLSAALAERPGRPAGRAETANSEPWPRHQHCYCLYEPMRTASQPRSLCCKCGDFMVFA